MIPVRENEIILANVLENVDIAYFISIHVFCFHILSKSYQYYCFCYTADRFELGKNILSQGIVMEKLKLKDNGHSVTCICTYCYDLFEADTDGRLGRQTC